MSLLALSFIHPALLGGLALGAVPIIIHILNRRRFKTMDWAAMDFLLKAAVRNRRRVRLENLILLAIRVLIVLLLVLAVTRPFTEGSSFAGMFGSQGAVERIFLFDDSHSMRAGVGNTSAFQRGKELLKSTITTLNRQHSPDRVTVMLGSSPRSGDRRITRVAVAGGHAERMLKQISAMRVSEGTFKLVDAIESLLEEEAEQSSPRGLHVLSDFRRRDWTTSDGELRPEVLQVLARFAQSGEVHLADLGGAPIQNVAVTKLVTKQRAVISGVPATYVATIRNYGPDVIKANELSVEFDFGGGRRAAAKNAEPIQPRQEIQIKKEWTLRSARPTAVSASVPTDVLPGDGTRRIVVNARRAMRFLLVDGEPSPEAYRGESDYLAAALVAPGEEPSGIEVEVVAEHSFTGRELEEFDGVFLCNVYRLDRDSIERLEAFVRGGGGLVFFLGDQVDPLLYNATFYGVGTEAGKHLLPLPLGEVEGSTENYVHFTPPGVDHPVLRFLRGMPDLLFRTIAIRYYMRTEPGASDGEGKPRVLVQYTDEDDSVALAEKAFGDGRVMMFTTAADMEWSDYPLSPLYLAMLHEIARYVVKPDPGGTVLQVFDPIELSLDPKRLRPHVRIVPPPDSGRASADLPAEPDQNGGLRFRYEGTDLSGIYTLEGRTPGGDPVALPYAVNVDPTEGDLRRADPRRIAAAIPGARYSGAEEAALLAAGSDDRTEFWRLLLYVLAAFALLETFLAWRFGHHHTGRLETAGKRVFVR
ncbi:MAG: BatA domain-containing protein [Planctomycetota bacterium]